MSQTITTTRTTTYEYDSTGRVTQEVVVTVEVIEGAAGSTS